MIKLFLVFALLSSAWAETLILEKHAYSGYVMPEHRFQKNCTIFKEGRMESMITTGDQVGVRHLKEISKEKVIFIQQLLKIARKGKVEEQAYPCDVGTTIYRGWTNGQMVELDIAKDCQYRHINSSAASKTLKKLATNLCGF
jgi:hypothetical protein